MSSPEPEATRRYRRHPYLLVTWEGRGTVLLHCHTLRRFRVDGALIHLLSALDQWMTREELAVAGHSLADDQLGALVDLGVVQERLGVVQERLGAGEERLAGDGPQSPSTTGLGEGLRWDPVDLAAQRRSTTGGSREAEIISLGEAPPPAFKRPAGPATALPPPANLTCALQDALSHRRSVRRYAERPLTLAELSTVLHHTARITTVHQDPVLGDVGRRPFASAGGRCELEVYVVANDVAGLAAGAHYYDPRAHQLVKVRRRDDHQERINQRVQAATGGELSRDPPMVLLITAVFARVMWKYQSMGLALVHKDAGCFLQTLYLVATAMGLAPCAVGGGEETATAHWLGLDPLVESQVACLLLGPRRDVPSTRG